MGTRVYEMFLDRGENEEMIGEVVELGVSATLALLGIRMLQEQLNKLAWWIIEWGEKESDHEETPLHSGGDPLPNVGD